MNAELDFDSGGKPGGVFTRDGEIHSKSESILSNDVVLTLFLLCQNIVGDQYN